MRKLYRSLLVLPVIVMIAIVTNQAYAQTPTQASDNAVMIVIIASFVGGLLAPIILWASKEQTPDSTGKLPNDPFNVRQYVLAVLVGIPALLAILVTEVTSLNGTVGSLQSLVIIFLMAFVQGLGIDTAKSRIGSAITNP